MKIAIASSGLGHVARGIERWALDLAEGLADYAASHEPDTAMTLFAAAPLETAAPLQVVPCLKRGDRAVRMLTRLAPACCWRLGWKAPYAVEQRSFARLLIRELRRNPHDIVHTQDLVLAKQLEKAVQQGRISTQVILAHGTDEPAEALAGLRFLQHLAPVHHETLAPLLKDAQHYIIPNFVDAKRFSPASDQQREGLRKSFGIPSNAFVIGFSGALKRVHKRFDALITEVATAASDINNLFLLATGAETADTESLVQEARKKLSGNFSIRTNVPFDEMPDYYRVMDLYAHPAPLEFFGICLLEAMACGVPVVVNDSPVLEWIVDSGGWRVDVTRPGFLRESLNGADLHQQLQTRGAQARARVETRFSRSAVIPQITAMYREVMEG